MTEFDLIRDLLTKVNQPGRANAATDVSGGGAVWLGPGDDAAVIVGTRLVMSTDLTVEDIHFRRSWVTFAEAGTRAVTAAASDLAAMAATPVAVLISLAVAPEEAKAVLSELGDGIKIALDEIGAPLVGGDLSASPGPVFMDVTVVGAADEPVTRTGSHVGDEFWVTGVLGGSAGAVRGWQAGVEPSPNLRAAFVRPKARIEEARWLAERTQVKSMIDISDGLMGDARHLAAASGVRIVLDPSLVPVHPDLSTEHALLLAMTGGEDYELGFMSPPGLVAGCAGDFQDEFGIRLTRVGHVEEGRGVEVVGDAPGVEGVTGGFDHFSAPDGSC